MDALLFEKCYDNSKSQWLKIMIRKGYVKVQLLQYYQEIQQSIKIKNDNNVSNLVHPSSSLLAPIHNWYHFKEGFSPNLLNYVINNSKINSDKLSIFDPFCGSGTTLLSALVNTPGINISSGLGVEVNPFIHFVANTKVQFFKLNMDKISRFINYISSKDLIINNEIEFPDLTTIEKAFSISTFNQLENLKNLIKDYFHETDYEYNFCLLAYSSILETVSCMRKSGRALKIVKEIEDYDVKTIFLEKIINMINDVITEQRNLKMVDIKIQNHDIRDYNGSNKEKYNLVVFSPPYLNHFDYTEVYKIELWMLDFVTNYSQFRQLRYNTFRSHPSVKFDKTNLYSVFNSKIIKDIIGSLDAANKQEAFYKTIRDYIDDMYKTLIRISSLTTSDSTIACIVANSLFGSTNKNNLTTVATDLIITEIAKDLNFEVVEIVVARELSRRGLKFPYGRESIIYLRKKRDTFDRISILNE